MFDNLRNKGRLDTHFTPGKASPIAIPALRIPSHCWVMSQPRVSSVRVVPQCNNGWIVFTDKAIGRPTFHSAFKEKRLSAGTHFNGRNAWKRWFRTFAHLRRPRRETWFHHAIQRRIHWNVINGFMDLLDACRNAFLFPSFEHCVQKHNLSRHNYCGHFVWFQWMWLKSACAKTHK